MYSMFDLFFDTPAYRPIYVISDSEMEELQRTQNQDELEEIRHQKKRLEESYKAQVKHCLLYTSPSPRDATLSRMPSSA